ncbi:hypothetical protein ACKUB1_03835 [Methanospirillum stamsii]|uniref:Uncharacterized protein n=1 Tax=Methanospirillum stamsii TaxID=1277351 RepID=A0A2V2N7H9_9EURY|nr:hypothetical protein [Methanospirillum stamsii]PWR72458.1 hypothetical protein DLD82_12030 [Methanospirillum stamsii]
MNLIRTTLLTGALIYGLIFIVELIRGHILLQAIIGVILILGLAALPFSKEEHLLHNGEMVAVWTCILLFGLYAILKSGGLV